MNESYETGKSIQDWAASNVLNPVASMPISIHVDSFLTDVSTNLLTESIRLYQQLVDYLVEIGLPVQPILVIPLLSKSNSIQMQVPYSLSELRNQIDTDEPPSLYLVSWESSKGVAVCEEYRMPLSFDLGMAFKQQSNFSQDFSVAQVQVDELRASNSLAGSKKTFYSYYREYRYGLALRNRWEYSRCIYVEYYPEGIHIQ